MIANPAFRLARSIESENSLVGLCLLDSTLYPDAAARITAADLFVQSNRILWQIMADHQPGTWDMPIIADALATAGQLDQVGGRVHLVTLAQAATSRHLIPTYCQAIREAAARRSLQSLGADLMAESEDVEVVEYATRQAAALGVIATGFAPDKVESFADEVTRTVADIVEANGKPYGIPTGFPVLDGLLTGLVPSDLILLAARPSIGKTALGINIAQNILERGEPVAFASLEMSRKQIIHRLLAAVSGIEVTTLARGGVARPDPLIPSGGRVSVMKLSLTDRAAMSVPEIRVFAKESIERNGPGPLIVDYLGLIRDTERAENRNLAVAAISAGLKAIAKDLSIPVIALSQLNRESDKHGTRRPRLTDLRDSGALEQDADVVLLLHRENRGAREAVLEIAKHRNGPTGEVQFVFDGPRCRFDEVAAANPFRPITTGGPSL